MTPETEIRRPPACGRIFSSGPRWEAAKTMPTGWRMRGPVAPLLVLVAWPAALSLQLCSAPLLCKASLLCALWNPGLLALLGGPHGLGNQALEPRGNPFTVLLLAPARPGGEPKPALGIQTRCQALEQPRALGISEGRRCRGVPPQFDLGRRTIHMLAAWPAGSRSAVCQLPAGNAQGRSDAKAIGIGVARHTMEARGQTPGSIDSIVSTCSCSPSLVSAGHYVS